MILIVYLIENHSHLIKVENHAERACFDMLAIGLDILGPGRFRPGPPNSNNALLRAGHFLLVGRTCYIKLLFVLVHMTSLIFELGPRKATPKESKAY